MKRKFWYFFLLVTVPVWGLLFVICASIALAAPLEYGNCSWSASGFGTTAADGTYTLYHSGAAGSDGVSDFSNGTFILSTIDSGTYWIVDTVEGNTGPTYYYVNQNTIPGTYTHDSQGSSPGGTISLISCYTPPAVVTGYQEVWPLATGTPVSNYSIDDNPNQDMQNGLWDFFAGFLLMVFLFR